MAPSNFPLSDSIRPLLHLHYQQMACTNTRNYVRVKAIYRNKRLSSFKFYSVAAYVHDNKMKTRLEVYNVNKIDNRSG